MLFYGSETKFTMALVMLVAKKVVTLNFFMIHF